MPTCSVNTSSEPFHSNNYCHDRVYNAYSSVNKEQFYDGEFFRDCFHGQGTYKWNDIAVYEGGFYSNYKEGYASVSLPDNSYFEGLFIRNSPFGPGILTYANGRQDAGFWLGKKLVRLSRAVDFIIPRLAPTSAAKIRLLQFRRLIPLSEENWDLTTDFMKKCGYPFEHFYSPFSRLMYDPRSIFFDKSAFEKTYFVNAKEFSKEFLGGQKNWQGVVRLSGDLEEEGENMHGIRKSSVPAHCLCQQDIFSLRLEDQNEIDVCERESTEGEFEMGILRYFTKFGTLKGLHKKMSEDSPDLVFDYSLSFKDLSEENVNNSRPPNIVSWNRSELCTEMLKQIFRYRTFEDKLNFNLAKLMLGARTDFRRTGLKEQQSVQFLKMCSIGPAHIVKDLLCSSEISEELMDARGNNSLMFAAATDQHDIIDILLDYGVDVNTFNDENLTPLNLCLLRKLAQANGISSWETAFLPKEIDTTPADRIQTQEWQNQESISSLDRVFGDGMSINDSKCRIFDTRTLTPFPSPNSYKELEEMNQGQKTRCSAVSGDLSNLSQITILNIPKSPGSHSLIQIDHNDDVIRSPVGLRRSASASAVPELKAQEPLGSNEETPKINLKLIPKSNRRDEFVKSMINSGTDQYLFAIHFDTKPKQMKSLRVEGSAKSTKVKNGKEKMEGEQQKEESGMTLRAEASDFEIAKKIAAIDKTIQKLLRRGADPNISEVPKPSIHLGIYTKDLNTVYNLLLYGADPNSQLYSNEGLLTPLHVVVLQRSAPEYVDICELLLNFGADPLKETLPEFSLGEEEAAYLDSQRGRIPLQLLCMRPDLEYADPDDNLIKMGLILAKEVNIKCFYNGHSCLTLAMLTGNIKLLQALLESKLFDPNDILEKDRGTALHVLVSTELQKKTSYDSSIKMCDLLTAAGANPLMKFRHPKSLQGTCVDYGYREIETEMEARRASVSKEIKKIEKFGKDKVVKDYLSDHRRVVEYLNKIASNMTGKRKTSKRGIKKKGRGDESLDSLRGDLAAPEEVSGKFYTEAEGKDGKHDVKQQREELKKKKKNELDHMTGSKNKKDVKPNEEREKLGKREAESGKEKAESSKEKAESGKEKAESSKEKAESSKERAESGKAKAESGKEKAGKKASNRATQGENEKSDTAEKTQKTEKAQKVEKAQKIEKAQNMEKIQKIEKAQKLGKGRGTEKDAVTHQIKGFEKDLEKSSKNIKTRESGSKNLATGPLKTLSTKHLGTCTETFPEKLRQELLKMYGNCVNIDVNEFLVPYVVLRDGELYYRFQGNIPPHKEQYSLI